MAFPDAFKNAKKKMKGKKGKPEPKKKGGKPEPKKGKPEPKKGKPEPKKSEKLAGSRYLEEFGEGSPIRELFKKEEE